MLTNVSEKLLLRRAIMQTKRVVAGMEKDLKGYTKAHEKYAYFKYQVSKLRDYNAALTRDGFPGICAVDKKYDEKEKKLRADLWGIHR